MSLHCTSNTRTEPRFCSTHRGSERSTAPSFPPAFLCLIRLRARCNIACPSDLLRRRGWWRGARLPTLWTASGTRQASGIVCVPMFTCVYNCMLNCIFTCVHVCIVCIPALRSLRTRGRVTICVCSATAPGDGQHSRLRAASSQRLRLFCLIDRAQHHAELLEGAARANRACFRMLPRALLQHAHKIQDVGISGAAGDLAHDDQCGMEDVVQHTLRICRFDHAAAGFIQRILPCCCAVGTCRVVRHATAGPWPCAWHSLKVRAGGRKRQASAELCVHVSQFAPQERLADRADTSGLLKVCHAPLHSAQQVHCATQHANDHRAAQDINQFVLEAGPAIANSESTVRRIVSTTNARLDVGARCCSALLRRCCDFRVAQALSARVSNLDCDRSISVSNSFLR